MATWTSYRVRSIEDLMNLLNGALLGSQNLHDGALVDGLTFIVDIGGGAVTTTFTPAKSRAWTLTEIVTQINTALSEVVGSVWVPRNSGNMPDRRLRMLRDGALTIKKTGTANTVLGYSTAADVVSDPMSNTEATVHLNHDERDVWNVLRYV